MTLNKLSPELAAAIARIDELEDYVEKLQAYIEVDETTKPIPTGRAGRCSKSSDRQWRRSRHKKWHWQPDRRLRSTL